MALNEKESVATDLEDVRSGKMSVDQVECHVDHDAHHDGTTNNAPVDPAAEGDGEDFQWNTNIILNLMALYMTFWATVWSYSVLPTSIAFIDKAFPTQTGIVYWIASSPSLCQCVLSLFIGELSDIFGRRWFLLAGNACMLAGNLIVGRGVNAQMVIGGQVINGVGIALGFLVTPLLAECVPKRSRSFILAVGTLMSGIVLTLGCMAQGAFAQFNIGGLNQGWRIGCYIGALNGFVAIILVWIFYHPGRRPNPEHLTTRDRFLMIDWTGLFLGTAGLVLFLVGIDSGGNPFSWKSPTVVSTIVIGVVLLIVFGIWEWRFAKFGLFPRSVFQHRNFPVSLAAYFIEGMVINSSTAYLAQINLSLFTTNQLLALVRSLQLGLSTIVGSAIVSVLLFKYREAKWLLVGSLLISTLGCGLMIVLQPHISYPAFFFPTALIGLSIGGIGVLVPVVISLCTPNELIATAVSLSTSVRGLGGSIGVVITSQVFQAKLKAKLPVYAAEAAIRAGLPVTSVELLLYDALDGHTEDISTIPGITAAVLVAFQEGVAQAYADSWRYVWYVLLPFSAIVLLFAFMLQSTKAQMTQEVASPVKDFHNHHHGKEEDEKIDAAA